MDKIALKRAAAGLSNDLVEVAFEHHRTTGSWDGVQGVLMDALASSALDRFEPKIRNGFERVGLTLPDGPLTIDGMREVIAARIGIEPASLTPEGIKQAFDEKLSQQISDDTGLSIGSVLGAGIKEAIRAEIVRAIVDGRAHKLLDKVLLARMKRQKAFKQEGYTSPEDQRKVLLRLYQKRYRRRNRLVWDK